MCLNIDIFNFWLTSCCFVDSQKVKSNGEKSSQLKSNNSATKVNGEGSITSDNDSKKDKLGTKEPIVNGTETACENVVNGDPKKHSDCDISSSDNTKVVTNGVNSESDNTKSSKSDAGIEVIPNVCPNKAKHVSDVKKERKTKATDKNNESDKKGDSEKNKKPEKKEDEKSKSTENVLDKVNGETNKIMNGDKDRESSPSEDGDEKKRDAEVVFIQDLGFTVKIVSPGAEPLDIQVIKHSM